jgi:hypothetical protein
MNVTSHRLLKNTSLVHIVLVIEILVRDVHRDALLPTFIASKGGRLFAAM